MLIRPAAVAPGTCCYANQVFSPEDADREFIRQKKQKHPTECLVPGTQSGV